MMRYKSISLTNFIGIYNGMGLYDISIDFTKCKNNIIVIKGDNGSGKSTLYNAISVLQDDSSMFIPGKEARKVVEIFDEDMILYKIEYLYSPKKDGGYSTKGFFYKMIEDQYVVLNEQGNITACKDLIFTEFNLDPCFDSLSQLSSRDKGMGNKTPAERKQYLNRIINNLEVYNNICKTMSKRSSVFKSMMNSISSKINIIGDESILESSLKSIEKRLADMEAERNSYLELLGSQKTTIQQLDPNGAIQSRYDDILSQISTLQRNRTVLQTKIASMLGKKDIEISEGFYSYVRDQKMKVQTQITEIESAITRLLSDREEESRQLNLKVAKLNSLNSETNYIDMKNLISTYEAKIVECEEFFKTVGIIDYTITRDEYVVGLNTLVDIKATVDVFRDTIDYDIMKISLSEYVPTWSYPDIDSMRDELEQLKLYVAECKEKLNYYGNLLKVMSKLSVRPGNCNIDSCEFIKDAVEAANESPAENIDQLSLEIADTEAIIIAKEIEFEKANKIVLCINYFRTLFRYIDTYSSILKKLPNGHIFSNKEVFIQNLLNGSSFEEINVLYSYISQASIFENYKSTVEALKSLKADLKIYESKNELIEDISNDISLLNQKIDSVTREIEERSSVKFSLQNELSQYTDTEVLVKTLLSLNQELQQTEIDAQAKQIEINSIQSAISQIQTVLTGIEQTNNSLARVNKTIKELESDKGDIKYAITQLHEYLEEYEEYKAKYAKIEVIKKFSSPTTGIQLVYMELYMHKVISVANQLLQYVLNGEYRLEKPVLNEREFRLPCQGEGLLNDDITSLSDGQLAITAMIISFSLLFQSSTKYNVLKLDEVDAPLDTVNRSQFLIVLDNLMKILNCQQCIMISHNSELNLQNTDMIILRTSDQELYNAGNVIWRYAA